jgi:RNA polymerase sigma-70 factor (ECF subfamily)
LYRDFYPGICPANITVVNLKNFLILADIPDKVIKGCINGNTGSQTELYRLLAPKMYALCLQYAGHRDEAKDIMQDAFIKVYQKIDQFSGKGSFEGWVRRIMINTALEKYRSRVINEPITEKTVLKEEAPGSDSISDITAAELINLIQTLTPQYRMVFNLYALEGYNHKEIGEMLGISEGTSKSNLSRARIILQEKIHELYGSLPVIQEND